MAVGLGAFYANTPGIASGVPAVSAGNNGIPFGVAAPTAGTHYTAPAVATSHPAVTGANTNGGVTAIGNAATGSGSSSSTGATATDPNYAAQTGQIKGLINQINGLYTNLFGNFNQGVAAQRGSIENTYNNQEQQLADQYAQAAPQLGAMMAARGLSDSSYANTAQANAGQTFNDQSGGITAAQNQALQQLSQQAQTQLGTYQGQQAGIQNIAQMLPNIPNDSSGQYELGTLQGQLAGDLGPLQGAIGGAQNSSALANLLNLQAPSQVYNPQALQSQLQTLGQSSIPGYAQSQIASALINNGSNNQSNPGASADLLNYAKNLGIQ